MKIHVIGVPILHIAVNRQIQSTDPEGIDDLRHIIIMIVMVMRKIHVKTGLIVILEPLDHSPVGIFISRIHEQASSTRHQICCIAIGLISQVDRIYFHVRRSGAYFLSLNRQYKADQHNSYYEFYDSVFHFLSVFCQCQWVNSAVQHVSFERPSHDFRTK